MPVFEFDEGPSKATTPNGPGPKLLFTMPEAGNTVTFTLSATVINFNTNAATGGSANAAAELVLNQATGAGASGFDVFRLTATSTGGGSGFSGTAIQMSFGTIRSPWTISFTGGTAGPVQRTVRFGDSQFDTAVSGRFTGITFTSSFNQAQLIIKSLTANIACFLAGTRIATPDGEVPVETLRPGDPVRTAAGGVSRVRWLGRQTVDPRIAHPAWAAPVRIRAGALGEGLPARDLCVSPDHALGIDGVLITAGALVNGRTIVQTAAPAERFTYYHIETEAHELLLAEGCPAESFIGHGAFPRQSFDNWAEAPARAQVAEMPLLRISSARLVPEVTKDRLAARASSASTVSRRGPGANVALANRMGGQRAVDALGAGGSRGEQLLAS